MVTPLPFRLGGYGAIVADPPWPYDDQAGRMRLPYGQMSEAEIYALPVDHLAAERSHLYLWVVDAHLELGLQCVKRWGFTFKRTIAWVKTTLDGSKLRIGGGHYVRGAHELCLFGVRSQTGLVRNVPSVIFAPRRAHSRKPDALLEIAERLSPGPRIELFARRSGDGWVSWGNEAPKEAING